MDMKQCNDKKEHIRMKTHSGKTELVHLHLITELHTVMKHSLLLQILGFWHMTASVDIAEMLSASILTSNFSTT
jgi:hypothetical protein